MSDHLITTPAKGDVCPRCQTVTLSGIAEGLHARVDLTPLNPAGELAALLAGRRTYTLTRSGLVERDATRIAGQRLTAHGPTLPTHACLAPIPAEHLAQPQPPVAVAAATDAPPF